MNWSSNFPFRGTMQYTSSQSIAQATSFSRVPQVSLLRPGIAHPPIYRELPSLGAYWPGAPGLDFQTWELYSGASNLPGYTDSGSGEQPNGIMGIWNFQYDTLNRVLTAQTPGTWQAR
jgi:hypothetical protein